MIFYNLYILVQYYAYLFKNIICTCHLTTFKCKTVIVAYWCFYLFQRERIMGCPVGSWITVDDLKRVTLVREGTDKEYNMLLFTFLVCDVVSLTGDWISRLVLRQICSFFSWNTQCLLLLLFLYKKLSRKLLIIS